jgi:cyclophilin family peptidyl-prolyl cis-trans isomerase
MFRPRFPYVVLGASVLAGVTLISQQAQLPAPQRPGAAAAGPTLVLDTVKGVIEIELFPGEAPKSVARVLELAKGGFYRGQRFHWVQPGIVQFGDPFSRDMTKEKQWGNGGSGYQQSVRPIGVLEPSKRKFERGTVGMAYRSNQRAEDADSQMFILTAPNPPLNGKYTLIGQVTRGLAVVEKLEKADTIKNLTIK